MRPKDKVATTPNMVKKDSGVYGGRPGARVETPKASSESSGCGLGRVTLRSRQRGFGGAL